MSAHKGMRCMSNKHQFQCQTGEILYLCQHKKSLYKICRVSYMHSISTPHSFITLKILPIIQVSTGMKLNKQTVGGQQKGKAGHTTTVHRRIVFTIFTFSDTKGNSQQIHHCMNQLAKHFRSEEVRIRQRNKALKALHC